MPEGPLRAARTHHQADRGARDHALSLGASGRGEVSGVAALAVKQGKERRFHWRSAAGDRGVNSEDGPTSPTHVAAPLGFLSQLFGCPVMHVGRAVPYFRTIDRR